MSNKHNIYIFLSLFAQVKLHSSSNTVKPLEDIIQA